MSDTVNTVDTVVVGAGLSGLAAASKLSAAGQRVRVIEAATEVGGRTRTGWLDAGVPTEFGGEWIGPLHRHMLHLVDSVGVHLRAAGQFGRPILWHGGQRSTVRRLPPLNVRTGTATLRACWKLDRLGRGVDPVRPWLSPGAEAFDDVTVGAWLRGQGVHGDAMHYLATVLGALMSADIERVSLLHVLWWIARGNGLLPILRTTFAYNVVEGAQSIATRLAERLGDGVELGAPVHRIAERDRIEVCTVDGRTTHARHAVVTAPVGCLSAIEFSPGLPGALAALDQLGGTSGTKVTALLPAGHRIRHRSAIGAGTVGVAWRVGRRLTGFATHGCAAADDDDLVEALAGAFGCDRGELTAATVFRWGRHGYIPACDIGFRPGQLFAHGPNLGRAHGNVHFAGAERSSWPNNMEGAVESGTRAAMRILAG